MLANMPRLYEKMREFRLDVIIATCPENVVYLTDHQCHRPFCFRHHNAESFAIVPQQHRGKTALVIPANDGGIVCATPPEVDSIYTYGKVWTKLDTDKPLNAMEKRFRDMVLDSTTHLPSASEALIAALRQLDLAEGTIGLDFKNMAGATLAALRQSFPKAYLVDVYELLRVVRMVKTPEELELLRTAGLKNEKAVQRVLRHAGDGVSETELTRIYMTSVAEQGGLFEYWNTAAGTASAMAMMSEGHFRPPSPRHLKRGDLFRYDGGSIFGKYHADAGGCASIGEPDHEKRTIYAALSTGIERIQELLRPGALPSVILEQAIAAVEKAGLKNYDESCFFCGHGMGLEARDHPVFTKPVKTDAPFLPGTLDLPLEENMVVSIELPYGQLGLGGFQIEYTMLVTRTGAEKLFPHHRELVVC